MRTIGAEEVIAMEEDADLEFCIFCLFALGGFKLEEDEDQLDDISTSTIELLDPLLLFDVCIDPPEVANAFIIDIKSSS